MGAFGGQAPPPVDSSFASVVALLHFPGADASTTFTDVKGHTFTANNTNGRATANPEIDTAISKFGGSSGRWPYDSNLSFGFLECDHADFALGTGDFCAEAWLTPTSVASRGALLCLGTLHQAGSLWFGWEGIASTFYVRIGGVSNAVTSDFAGTINVAQHIAVTRAGTNVRVFFGGVQVGATGTSSGDITATALRVGGTLGSTSYALNHSADGYMDDFRLTKGVARYTANFTPPTAAFPDSA